MSILDTLKNFKNIRKLNPKYETNDEKSVENINRLEACS
jgi:hypothetical protein